MDYNPLFCEGLLYRIRRAICRMLLSEEIHVYPRADERWSYVWLLARHAIFLTPSLDRQSIPEENTFQSASPVNRQRRGGYFARPEGGYLS